MIAVGRIAEWARQAFAVFACLCLLVWSLSPTTSHVPTVLQTLQEHAEMIETHGHSHGLEEDLAWAMHGHSHDAADHDHSQAVLLAPPGTASAQQFSALTYVARDTHWAPPVFRLERPPRA